MTPKDYTPKTTPRAHQLRTFLESADLPAYGLFHEQRTGKSKIIIDTAAYHYQAGRITGLIVIAWPAGVHRNWITDECPTHMPLFEVKFDGKFFQIDDMQFNRLSVINTDTLQHAYMGHVWQSSNTSKSNTNKLEQLLTFPGLAILSINAEAILTDACRAYIKRFLDKRPSLVMADESTFLKTPGAKRTEIIRNIGKHRNVKYRRIGDGTPTDGGPLDYYSQFRFLDGNNPPILGHTTYTTYKNFFAEWESNYNSKTDTEYSTLVKYRNLDVFSQRIAPYSSRILRQDISDAPDKTYQKHYFQISPEQRKLYNKLRDEFKAELSDGRTIDATLVLTRYLRLQQITGNHYPQTTETTVCPSCNFVGCEQCDGLGVVERIIPAIVIDHHNNPRLEAAKYEIERTTGPVIVWSRFKSEVDDIIQMGQSLGRTVVRYDGQCSDDQKLQARRDFQSGSADLLVGSPRAGGRGVKLSRADLIIYYSNEFSLISRLQSEDRGEDLSKTTSTGIIDLVAEDTVDELIVQALRDKKNLADIITGDKSKEWL